MTNDVINGFQDQFGWLFSPFVAVIKALASADYWMVGYFAMHQGHQGLGLSPSLVGPSWTVVKMSVWRK